MILDFMECQVFFSEKLKKKIEYCLLQSGVILEGDLGEKVSLSWLTSLSWAEGEVKMYRRYREIL